MKNYLVLSYFYLIIVSTNYRPNVCTYNGRSNSEKKQSYYFTKLLDVAFCKMFQLLISLDPLITGFLPLFYDYDVYAVFPISEH